MLDGCSAPIRRRTPRASTSAASAASDEAPHRATLDPRDDASGGEDDDDGEYDEEEMSELSELAESDEDDDGEYASSAGTDSEDEGATAGDALDDDAAAERASSKTGGRRNDMVWTRREVDALYRAVALVPNLGRRHFTGVKRGAWQIQSKLRTLSKAAGDDSAAKQALKGARVAPSSYADRDWDAFLGPDLHSAQAGTLSPAARNKKRASNGAAEPKQRRRKAPRRASDSPPPPAQSTSCAEHPRKASIGSAPVSPQEDPRRAFSTSFFAATVPSSLPQPNAPPTKPSLDVKPGLPDDYSTGDIHAFLTSLSLAHNFTAASRFLLSAGISSSSTLADLLLLKPSMLDAFLETAQERQKVKLPALEMAWLRRVLALAREAMGAEGRGECRVGSA
ncbi:hypothetical protein JCM10449v2_002165 [Rhodotorula kratochvilovae]